MAEQRLFNVLQLAYTPLSNYDFVMVKDDAIIQHFINSGKLYVIAQRPVLTFENFYIDGSDPENPVLKFELHQKGREEKLECEFPLFQDEFNVPFGSRCDIAINYTYPKSEVVYDYKMPFSSMANFVVNTGDDYYWISPEKLIYHYLRDALEINIKGDVTLFLKYKVHYIGKATEQDIIKRLTGHSHLQDILSIERPFHYGALPTEEIAILFLSFKDNIFMNTFSPDDDEMDIAVNMLMGKKPIEDNVIYLDAEKALINALKPKHNKLQYNNYPASKDGLQSHNLDFYTFNFSDPFTLIYDNGEIVGCRDSLIVEKSKTLQIRKGGV
ncbi:hypothetical protein HQN86_12350 [Pedobacter panaciterrae]|uniref:hypothetical protein n=1 Tax=Pedobacter panaciterrae TaxID=363849 RepID=UPI00155D9BDC|nr:hypothetical protein [Pedobacter panaciterrae]NQX54407.1 hypothetical protein [Pedobacter panaciterrae]